MYGSSSLSKSNTLPTSSTQEAGLGAGPAGSSTSYKQHAYDGSKSTSASGGYNYSAIPGNQGYIGTYMGVSPGNACYMSCYMWSCTCYMLHVVVYVLHVVVYMWSCTCYMWVVWLCMCYM